MTAMADTGVTETIADVTEAAQCCEPCGPDTCGSAVVAVELSTKIEAETAEAAQCCEPECGPDTC